MLQDLLNQQFEFRLHKETKALLMHHIHDRENRSNRYFHLANASVDQFIASFGKDLDPPVKNETHFEGQFSFDLKWRTNPGPDASGPRSSKPSTSSACASKALTN